MRWTTAAVLSVMLLLTAACQDGEIESLKAENERLKNNDNGGGNDRLIELLLAERQGGGDSDALERKLNSFSEDVQAGLSSIRDDIRKSEQATDSRMAKLEDRLDRVSDLESTIGSLKGMIETLEGKVRSVDPNETLAALKEKIQLEADLNVERKALEQAETAIDELRQKLEEAEAERGRLNDEIAMLEGEDISRHPEHRALQAELRKVKSELENSKSDYDILEREHKDLLEQVGNEDRPVDENTTQLLEDYEFAGRVTKVEKSDQPDGPSILLVGRFRGTTPPLGAQLVVLDEKNNRICDVKVIRHYRVNNNDNLPVEELGCQTLNESPTNPVTENDSVVWIEGDDEEEPAGSAGGD